MRFLRRLVRLLSPAFLFLTVWLLWPRELDGNGIGRDGKSSVPEYSMVNAHYVSVKAGKLEVETRATEASFNITNHRMDGKNVVALLYNANDERTIVTADKAVFMMDERTLHLYDHVNSLSADGFLLRGPEAVYSMKSRILIAPRPVEGETLMKEVQLWGDRAEAPLDENKVRLFGNARSTYMEQKHGLTKIRGDRAVLDRSEEKVTFEENVRVDQEKVVGTSKVADLFYSPSDKAVRYMSMTKDVKIMQEGGRYTRSQVAEFFAPTDTIVLTGFPSVYDGDDAVTGDKITVYRTTGVVEVMATNAAASQERAKGSKPNQPPPLTKEDEELIP